MDHCWSLMDSEVNCRSKWSEISWLVEKRNLWRRCYTRQLLLPQYTQLSWCHRAINMVWLTGLEWRVWRGRFEFSIEVRIWFASKCLWTIRSLSCFQNIFLLWRQKFHPHRLFIRNRIWIYLSPAVWHYWNVVGFLSFYREYLDIIRQPNSYLFTIHDNITLHNLCSWNGII